jgi:Flp pilus assembly protein TadG
MKPAKKLHNAPLVCGVAVARRKGAIAVLVAVLMIIFLMAVAFSVDVGYMQLSRTRLRIATDAAARAAGEALTRTQDLPSAIQAAHDLAGANEVAGDPLLLDDADILVGSASKQANGSWAFTEGGTPVNSIRVVGRRTRSAPSGSIPLLFGRVFNVFDYETTQTSTAVRMDRDICLVVDRSSSMKLSLTDTQSNMSTSSPRFCQPPQSDSRWAALAVAVADFNAALASTPQIEHVGLASFASNYTACGVTNNASEINQQLSSAVNAVNTAMANISARKFNGNTNIAAGLQNGINVLTNPATARPYALKTMILLTDGIRTDGGDPMDLTDDAVAQDITIHTITFGDSADQAEMQDIAAATGGKHYHAPDAQRLREVFQEIALTMLVTLTE